MKKLFIVLILPASQAIADKSLNTSVNVDSNMTETNAIKDQ